MSGCQDKWVGRSRGVMLFASSRDLVEASSGTLSGGLVTQSPLRSGMAKPNLLYSNNTSRLP